MENLREIVTNKRTTALAYQEFFSGTGDLTFVPEPDGSISNYWLNAILFPDEAARDCFLKESNENNVMSRPAWILMNKLTMFSSALSADISNALEIESRLVNIPSSFNKDGASK